MKTNFTLPALLLIPILLLASCTKNAYYPDPTDEQEWMRTHERGTVAYVDYPTGNYIVEINQGYSVIESWGGVAPREYDNEFAWFSSPGVQTIYNYEGNYFTKSNVVASWLIWPDALNMLDNISRGH